MADEDKTALALAAPLLPQVTAEKKKTTTTTTKKAPPPIPAVQLVSEWALLTAAIFLVSFAFTFALVHHDIHPPSWMLPRAGGLTDADAAEMGALTHGMMWSSVVQAAAAAAALLLPGRWTSGRRRALAYAAFAATAANHLMAVRFLELFLAADLGNIYAWITVTWEVSFLVKGDIRCLMALLGRGEYAN